MKKLLSIIICLCVFCGLIPTFDIHTSASSEIWDGTVATAFGGGTGAESDPYRIYTGSQLAYLAQTVNNGTNYEGKFFKLTNDIVLNNTSNWENWNNTAPKNEWTAIGSYDYSFQGTFDGDGHTVSGIYINNTSDYQGLFGYVYDGIIRNVGVTDSYIKGDAAVGGVVGYNCCVTVTNCYNTGSVTGSHYVGGVVGYNCCVTVENCYNTGSVNGNKNVGGVVGYNYGGTVTNCYNTGSVTGGDSVGGVVGDNYCGTVTNCYNTGSVTGSDYVGGVVGSFCGKVENCYNTGSVTGSGDSVGGVVGYNGYSTIYSTVENCYNTGSVTGGNSVGGVVGYNYCGTVTNCYYLSGCTKDGAGVIQYGIGNGTKGKTTADVSGQTTGLTKAQMKLQASFARFGFGYTWTMDSDVNNGYPFLLAFANSYGEWKYIISNDKAVIVYCDKSVNVASLPDTIEGYPIKEIRDDAFSGCSQLQRIEVSLSNSYFSSENGILYNKDKSTIIHIPQNLKWKLTIDFEDYSGNKLHEPESILVNPNGSYSYNTPQIEHYYTNYTILTGVLTDGDKTITVIYYEHPIASSGICGSNISWKLYEDGDLVIKGTGDMPNYSSGTAPWYSKASTVKNVYIDSSITKIGNYAFSDCSNLSYINMGVGIKSIGSYAFSNCTSLKNIAVPDSVTSIANGTFSGCSAIEEFSIPKNITQIGEKAFYGCSTLTTVNLSSKLTTIGNQAFDNCGNLLGVYFSGSPLASAGSDIFGTTSDNVVIYYYSTNQSWESAVVDGLTYLGYKAFPVGAIKQQGELSGNNIYYIKVVDEYNELVKNATVSLGGQSCVTNSYGIAYFTKPVEAVNLSVVSDNCSPYSDSAYMASKSQLMDIIAVSTKPSYVQGVSCDGESIASSVYTLNCNANEMVNITVCGHTYSSNKRIIKYELLQGNRLISSKSTSEEKCTFSVSKKNFQEGENIIVKMYTSDGQAVSSALNIDVVAIADISNTQILDELSSLSLAMNLGELGTVNLPISFNKSSRSKIYTYVKGRTITVGINMDVNNLIKTVKSPNNASLRTYMEKQVDNTLKDQLKISSGIGYKVCGYLEIEYLGNGQYYVKTNYVKVAVSARLSFNAQASFAGVIGVYFKAGLTGSGQLALKITRYSPESGFTMNSADINIENKLETEIGAYILWGIGSAGAYGNVKMGFDLQLVPKTEFERVYVTGELGARWSLFWGCISGSHTIAKGSIYEWSSMPKLMFMNRSEIVGACGDDIDYNINDRSYLNDRSDWLSGNKIRLFSANNSEYFDLQKSVYTNIEPKLATANGNTVMVWLDDDSTRSTDNFQMLCYSVYDEQSNTWSAPKQLDNNNTLDCEFDLVTDGNNIYVIYTEQKNELSGINTLDLENSNELFDFFKNTEVAFSVFENKEFSAPIYITDNSECEISPKLSISNGTVSATWVVTESLGISNNDKKDLIYYSEYKNGSWAEPVLLANKQNSVSEVVCGKLNNQNYSAYVVDADNSGNTADDLSLVLIDDENHAFIADTGKISQISFVKIDGQDALMWINDCKIYYTFDVNGTVVDAFEGTDLFTKQYKVLSAFDKSFLTFVLPSEDKSEETVAIRIGIQGAESQVIHLAKANGYMEKFDAVTLSDKFLIAFNETNALFEGETIKTDSNLRYMLYHFDNDIILNSLDYDADAITAGESLNISAEVKNNSLLNVNGLEIKLYDGDNNVTYEKEIASLIPFGETKTVSFEIQMPEKIDSDKYRLEVTASNQDTDRDISNNSLPIELKNYDVSVELEQKSVNNKSLIFAVVNNDGNMPTSATLSFYAGDENGRLLDSINIKSVEKNVPQQYSLELDNLINKDDDIITAVVKIQNNDIHPTNNKDSIKLFKISEESYADAEKESVENPTLSETYLKYDKYTDNDIDVEITNCSSDFTGITGLNKGTDYTINDNIITLKKSYLSTLSGTNVLNLTFKIGDETVTRTFTLDIFNTEPMAITGEVKANKAFVVGETVTADTSGIVPADAEILYKWLIDGETVCEEDSFEIPTSAIGKELTLKVCGTNGYTGEIITSGTVVKKTPFIPAAPIISEVTNTTITVAKLQGVEYSLDGESWQDDNCFTDLTQNKQYTVYARYKETGVSYSSAHASIEVITLSDEEYNALSSEFWDGSVASSFGGGAGTDSDPYKIYNGNQLALLAKNVNSGTNYENVYFKLMNNIYLNSDDIFDKDENGNVIGAKVGSKPNEWTPIGNDSSPFLGIFDGDKHTISGIYINNKSKNQGLFGSCKNALLTNIFVGYGYIFGNAQVAGLVGQYIVDKDNALATIRDCYNYASVYSTGWWCGGLVGYINQNAKSSKIEISQCVNGGIVKASGDCVGGIVGFNKLIDGSITIKNCYNSEHIQTGNGKAGGIVGYFYVINSESVDNPNAEIILENCYNIGDVSGISYIGSIVGIRHQGYGKNTVKNCYYLSGCAKDGNGVVQYGIGNSSTGQITADVSGKIIGLIDEQMKEQSSFVGFDFDKIWTMEGNPDYPYPELIGMYHGGEPSINAEFDKSGETINISITTENIPETAKIYFASYDEDGRLKEIKEATLIENSASAQMSSIEVDKIKVFAWSDSLMPYSKYCEWTAEQNKN